MNILPAKNSPWSTIINPKANNKFLYFLDTRFEKFLLKAKYDHIIVGIRNKLLREDKPSKILL
jgi:hypothetical protein